ncbi:MAG: hypothetical protein B7Y26_06295 [Hydrogenophilales bacterium 16-64-46]|nr:MAG: hypothetical protein B7Z32_00325 [Hydrogenophilales bacterium 12-64-13]OYZ05929.1 MAG: hypothetical protein B7Y26_06295 [Hydrogenophilales bacterium 16-64-46]OZA39865.1 MAG: hypothetical protein B7X87_02320 [Hydrogenophilales bacterium 17-64-34]HQT00287.1 DUF302 domain-containing protein [Thiobacillus sp.]
MTRFAPLAALMLASSTVFAAGPQPDVQAEMKKMQEAQAKLMAAMMSEHTSRLGYQETIAALQEAAKKRGWEVGPVVNMQEAMQKAGQKDARPFTMLAMCKKDLAETLLKAQMANRALPFAPCRISVFEGTDGKVYIAKPNTELMAQMAMPAFAPLLKQFVSEEKALLAGIAD